jgi:sulfate adenylyltransferase subunit 2
MTDYQHDADLNRLEAESIHILREVAACCKKPVLLYSIGKDSSVLLHLLIKAFAPVRPSIPLLHIDTGWKFQEMIAFRDQRVRETGVQFSAYINPEGQRDGVSPMSHGPALHTELMKTVALKQALGAGGFDAAIGGARRDEEKSRAKERIFSFRDDLHRWDPRRQRPELWRLYNTQVTPGESVRVFPLSNWTELDIWRYIRRERIPVVQLYFAKLRPVVTRGGALIMVDDARYPLLPGETPRMEMVRFRTLGCYPLTAAMASSAADLDAIILEMEAGQQSERAGRLIDHTDGDSMEKKKREGYF